MHRTVLTLLLLTACAGAAPPSSTPRARGAERWTAVAAEAWAQLDPARAARFASRAILAGAGADAREIAARAHLARGRTERAIDVLRGVDDPVLLRLRARAQMASGDYGGAAASLEAARRRAPEEDPWTEAVRPAVHAARDGRPYRTSGAARVELPLEELPLPVVRVRVDAIETLAVVGSGAHLAVVDPAIRAGAGVIDELTLGQMRVHAVPHIVRSLREIAAALGTEIGMVIGAELLLRLGATLNGPAGHLELHATPPVRPAQTSVPLWTATGTFLVVSARVGEREVWLTLDTAGLFPVALGPGAAEVVGLRDASWDRASEGLSVAVSDLWLGTLHVENVPFVRGLLDESHARAVEAPVSGSIGWILLQQLPITFDAGARRLRFE